LIDGDIDAICDAWIAVNVKLCVPCKPILARRQFAKGRFLGIRGLDRARADRNEPTADLRRTRSAQRIVRMHMAQFH
jgi:hypothetical protein